MVDRRRVPREAVTPLAVLLACIMAFVGLALAIGRRATQLDRGIHDWALTHRDGSVGLARAITQAGSATFVTALTLVMAGAVLARSRHRRRVWLALALVLTVVLAVSLRVCVSRLIERPRPLEVDWAVHATGWALPSGHTNAATLGAGLAAVVAAEVLRSRRPRVVVWLGAAAYALLVGWSRVWLGVHWPTDVLAGWLFGGAGASAVWVCARWLRASERPVAVTE